MKSKLLYTGLILLLTLSITRCSDDDEPVNAAPTVTNVMVTGNVEVDGELTVGYTYTDSEGDVEGETTFQWYSANDAAGAGEAAIAGATGEAFTITESLQGKYIRAGVIPTAVSGTLEGEEVKSIIMGAVGEATTATFTYNGAEVTYGILTSSVTGKKWLDRNLGAAHTPDAVDDYANYGDLFQWGRLADGHQLIARTGPNDADVSGTTGTTSATQPYEYSSADVPGHDKFIVTTNSGQPAEFDWRMPQNNNLWQTPGRPNNPCPSGWHVPTREEWAAENIGNIGDGFTQLKLTLTGLRSPGTGEFFQSNTAGAYWSSTVTTDSNGELTSSYRIRFQAGAYQETSYLRSGALACRCIKD